MLKQIYKLSSLNYYGLVIEMVSNGVKNEIFIIPFS